MDIIIESKELTCFGQFNGAPLCGFCKQLCPSVYSDCEEQAAETERLNDAAIKFSARCPSYEVLMSNQLKPYQACKKEPVDSQNEHPPCCVGSCPDFLAHWETIK